MTADAAPAADIQSKVTIFISYPRKELAFSGRLEAALPTGLAELFGGAICSADRCD